MYGYKLQFPDSIPKVLWACKTFIPQYLWKNINCHNAIEFTICEASQRTVKYRDSHSVSLKGKVFSVIVGDEVQESYADEETVIEDLSVNMGFDSLTYTVKELDESDLAEEDALLLPYYTDDVPAHLLNRIERLLYIMIEGYKDGGAAGRLTCASGAFEILSELDRSVRRSIRSVKDKFVNYYVSKAEAILAEKYSEKLTLGSVSAELGITPNYLSFIFKNSIGECFSSRLLEIRMKRAEELLKTGKYSANEIATMVGYQEESHLRRRFKQYFGVSIRDYTCISRELTLYHKKPQGDD